MNMMIQVTNQIDEAAADAIEDKLDPVLNEMVQLGPGQYQRHPSISKIFKWLVDPQRTPQEFNYVVGPMGKCNFNDLGRFKNLYLGLVAAEALAVKCPDVLDGPWKYAAWFVVLLNSEYCKTYNYGFVSDNLSDWIIRIMSDPKRCNDSCLRLEMMNMFGRMVHINATNGTKALKAVMSACCSLPLKEQNVLRYFQSDLTEMYLCNITNILEKFVTDGYLQSFDQHFAHILDSRVSSIISDMACSYGMTPARYSGYREGNMIRWFFRITLLFANVEFKRFKSAQFYPDQENHIEDVASALLVLVTNFKKSCQTPRLVETTAICVLRVLELVILVNIAKMDEHNNVYTKTLYTLHKVLQELSGGSNIVLSPVGQLLIRKYQDQLSSLRQKLGKYLPESDVICALLYNCTVIE